MRAHLAFALTLVAAAQAAQAASNRAGYEREIDSTNYNQVPKLAGYILTGDFIAEQKNRAKLITKVRPEEAVAADNVVLESNVVRIMKPARRRLEASQEALVRRRRGYNLENVWVPARYPYLPVPRYTRFRRRG